jgi:hypothetical protein
MPVFSFSTGPTGLVVPVLLGLNGKDSANLLAQGQPIPAPLHLQGLIDTGSDVTVVAPFVPRHFSLLPLRSTTTQGTTGSAPVDLYEMSLSILNPGGPGPSMASWDQLVVMESPRGIPSVDVIVGLDVLRECLLIFDGPGQRFILAV